MNNMMIFLDTINVDCCYLLLFITCNKFYDGMIKIFFTNSVRNFNNYQKKKPFTQLLIKR